jgi:hypothetical protein
MDSWDTLVGSMQTPEQSKKKVRPQQLKISDGCLLRREIGFSGKFSFYKKEFIF